jgi:hypothetical protein
VVLKELHPNEFTSTTKTTGTGIARPYNNGAAPSWGNFSPSTDLDVVTLTVRPRYKLLDWLTLGVDVQYGTGDGSASGNTLVTVSSVQNNKATAAGNTTTTTFNSTADNRFSGSADQSNYSLFQRAWMTFKDVKFSLGMNYNVTDNDISGTTRGDFSMTQVFDDGDGVANATDNTTQSSWTSYQSINNSRETTTITLPVATTFKLTDKLTARAGAQFSRTSVKRTYSETGIGVTNRTGTVTDGTGTVTAAGGGANSNIFYVDANGVPQAVDPRLVNNNTFAVSQETTTDATGYRLGLGYQYSENLNCDLMFTSSGNNGAANSSLLFGSITLTF